MATAIEKSSILTRSATTRRKRNAEESDQMVERVPLINKEVRRTKTVKARTPRNRQKSTNTGLTIETTPTLKHSDSIICISDTPEHDSPAHEARNNLEQLLHNDEKFARRLQQEFQNNYLEQIENEKKDREVAKRLQRLEQQQMLSMNSPLIPQQQQQSTTLITNNQIPQPTPIEPPPHIQFNRPQIPARMIPDTPVANAEVLSMLLPNDVIVRGSINGHPIIQSSNSTQVFNSFQQMPPQMNTNYIPSIPTGAVVRNNDDRRNINTNHRYYAQTFNNQNPNSVSYSSNNNFDKFQILTTYEYPVKNHHENSSIDNECSICLDEYRYKILVTHLTCMHKFHTSCIKSWLQTKDSCPICKKNAYIDQ